MGNQRFRLSDMIPNAWFYKLKDMGTRRAKTHKKKHPLPPPTTITITTSPPQPTKPPHHLHLHHPRQSYHFPRDDSPPVPFPNNLAPTHSLDPPRKSSKKRRSTSKRTPKKSSPRLVTTSVSADCSCRASIESVWTKPDSTTEEYPNSTTSSENESLFPEFGSDRGSVDNLLPWSPTTHTPCSCKPKNDIAFDVNSVSSYEKFKFENLELPRILTKKTEPTQIRRSSTKIEGRNAYGSLSVKVVKEDIVGISQKEQRTSPVKRNSVNSPAGMKLKINSPRIGSRKVQMNHRKSVSSIPTSSSSTRRTDSFAVVKSSKNPQQDFKESMVEMILEYNIKASKDLEELLACYLSLNSDEYHDLIIKVFKQIWFSTVDSRLN